MLHETQIHRELARQRAALCRAAEWRDHAKELREKADHMGDEMRAIAMRRVADDFDFLANFEERPRRLCL